MADTIRVTARMNYSPPSFDPVIATFGPQERVTLDFEFGSLQPIASSPTGGVYDLESVTLTGGNGRAFAFSASGLFLSKDASAEVFDARISQAQTFYSLTNLAANDTTAILSDFVFVFLHDPDEEGSVLSGPDLSAFNALNDLVTPGEQRFRIFSVTPTLPNGDPLDQIEDVDVFLDDFQIAPVPVPAALSTSVTALMALILLRRRRSRQALEGETV
ncbi:MAG: hypothetical protein AAF092_11060 [Pseudomonadota bacterium]